MNDDQADAGAAGTDGLEAARRTYRRWYKERLEKDEATAKAWHRSALLAVEVCARYFSEFSADQVWFVLGADYGRRGEMVGAAVSPKGRSALGPVLKEARRRGWITATGRVTGYDNAFTQRHRALLVWRSLIRGLEPPDPDEPGNAGEVLARFCAACHALLGESGGGESTVPGVDPSTVEEAVDLARRVAKVLRCAASAVRQTTSPDD